MVDDTSTPFPLPDGPQAAAQAGLTGSSAAGLTGSSATTRATHRESRRDFSSAIYGSVLTASVVIGSAGEVGPARLAVILVVTGLVFCLAHAYAQVVGSVHGGWTMRGLMHSIQHEWPLALAAFPPAAAALFFGLAGVSDVACAWAALIVALLQQQLFAYLAARQARLTGREMLRANALSLFIGLVMIGLKLLVSH